MPANPFTAPDASTPPVLSTPAPIDRAALAQANPAVISGARWFWWIAGLSLVNTIMLHAGSQTSFVIGLGFTLMADVVFQELKVVAFSIDALALGFFVAMGWFAGKGQFWAFVTGIIFYLLDACIYLFFQDWMSVGFHALALVYMAKGAMALRGAIQAAEFTAKNPPPAAA